MNFKKTISLFLCIFLTACATRNHPPAPLHQQSIVKQFKLDENEGRVHFFLGEWFMPTGSGVNINEAVELYVDNVKIGLIGNNKEYIAIDLYPGTYTLKWLPIDPGPCNCGPDLFQLSIAKGDLVFIKANMRAVGRPEPTAYMLFGAIGGAIGALAGENKNVTYFEPDINLRNNMNELTLVSLNQSFKQASPIKQLKIDKPSTENSQSAGIEKKLSELKSIYEKGLITKEEYDEKRNKLLERY